MIEEIALGAFGLALGLFYEHRNRRGPQSPQPAMVKETPPPPVKLSPDQLTDAELARLIRDKKAEWHNLKSQEFDLKARWRRTMDTTLLPTLKNLQATEDAIWQEYRNGMKEAERRGWPSL